MLLFIAFLCFAVLFAGWILAPTSAPMVESAQLPADKVTQPGTSAA